MKHLLGGGIRAHAFQCSQDSSGRRMEDFTIFATYMGAKLDTIMALIFVSQLKVKVNNFLVYFLCLIKIFLRGS